MSAESPDLSVLIVNWNGGRLLANCVASITAASTGMRVEILLVDNASTDDSLERLPDVDGMQLIRLPDNRGFAAATNIAAARARGRLLLLLNPDTECRPASLKSLVGAFDAAPNVGALGPRLLHTDGRVQRSAWRGYPGVRSTWLDALYMWKVPWLPGVRHSEVAARERAADVDHLLGACILTSADVWRDVGPLDEGYFLFLEETDWCRRVRATGRRVIFDPSSVVVHHGEHSVYQAPASSLVHYAQSLLRFVRNDGAGPSRILALKAAMATGAIVRLGLWAARLGGARRSLARGMIRGYRKVLVEIVHG